MNRVLYSVLMSTVLLWSGCAHSNRHVPRTIKWDSVKVELKDYLVSHLRTPEQYIVEKFRDHDVIFVGEVHYISHDPRLIQALVPVLHEHGVNALGLEFARRIDQAMIDSLMFLPQYSESLARDIIFREFIWWGFQEYVDILQAAWRVNHTLKSGEARFRVFGLNNSPDWSYVNSEKDRDDPSIMTKVWHGEDETDWAKVILDSVVAKGQKMLVYCGMHHAFTHYRQPKVVNGEFRG